MVHRRLEGNDWHRRIFCERIEHGILALFVPVLQRRKGSQTDCYTVSLEDANKLRDVLSLVRIHHRALAVLESPTRSARLEYDGIPAELINSDLHRRTRAQAGIEEHEGHRLSCERLGKVVARLESQG